MSVESCERYSWRSERDPDGHRSYFLTWIVITSDEEDGPFVVMLAPGLPVPGTAWTFGNINDPWAFATAKLSVKPRDQRSGEKFKHWLVEQEFTTKPTKRCQDSSIEDPLLEPQKISGSFVKYTKQAIYDKDGNPIRNSSYELLAEIAKGNALEFDANRPTVQIEQNVATLGLDVFSQMVDTVNDATLWGLGPRRIKLSNVSWERKIYGTCNYYYTRKFEFDVDFNTFDRSVLDEGTKVLQGHWDRRGTGHWVIDRIGGSPANPLNPNHYMQAQDRNGNAIRVVLDGSGVPAAAVVESGSGTGTGTGESGPAGEIFVQYYPESNFSILGLPTSL